MGAAEVPGAWAGELTSCDWLDRDLLVLTDRWRHGRGALGLPFREATVLELAGAELPEVTGDFGALAIDRSGLDPGWLARAVRATEAVLRPGSPVVIMLGRGPAGPPPGSGDHRLSGVEWRGLGTVHGQPCAVLGRTGAPGRDPGPVLDLLAVADLAARLGSGTPRPSGPARQALARHLEDRRQSEHALLQRLAAATQELERERTRPGPAAPVRDLLRRTRPGRAALRFLGRSRRAFRQVRRAVGPADR